MQYKGTLITISDVKMDVPVSYIKEYLGEI